MGRSGIQLLSSLLVLGCNGSSSGQSMDRSRSAAAPVRL